MPAITVLVPTTRIGGLDILFDSLEEQTFKDFELVLVDGLYDYRSEIVRKWAKRYHPGIAFTHVPARERPFPMNAYCQYMNTGLVHTRSPYLITLCDYSFLHPKCVETHATILSENPDKTACFAPYWYSSLPSLPEDLPTYAAGSLTYLDDPARYEEACSDAADRYVEDLKSGSLDSFMISIFTKKLTYDDVTALPIEYATTMQRHAAQSHCHLKNESFIVKDLLAINGWNEELDKSHGWQDSEISLRLARYGVKLTSTNEGAVGVVNPRHILYARKIERPCESNQQKFELLRGSGTDYTANAEMDIRKAHSAFNFLTETRWL